MPASEVEDDADRQQIELLCEAVCSVAAAARAERDELDLLIHEMTPRFREDYIRARDAAHRRYQRLLALLRLYCGRGARH
jgi:hypothetical protein